MSFRRRGFHVLGPDRPALASSPGVGGPTPAPRPGPAPHPPGPGPYPPANPRGPAGTSPAPSEGAINIPNPLAGVLAGIASAIGAGEREVVAAGSVFLGAVLIVAGLLLATGSGGRIARGAATAARLAIVK